MRAGKIRRYHNEGLKQLMDVPTILRNMRDAIFVVIGLIQSYFLLNKIKPDVIFTRGSYVGVPVCLAAKLRGIKYITHDSDSLPSLTNRVIGRWSALHLVALDKAIYPYPKDKTITTGIPISRNFTVINSERREEYRQKLNIPKKCKLIFVTGGGLGAKSLNDTLIEIAPNMLAEFKELIIAHVVGRKHEEEISIAYDKNLSNDKRSRVKVIGYTDEVYLYSGASDLVVTRAGATTLAELAIQGVACIILPNSNLVAGHQLKNAKILEDGQAAIVINDKDLEDNPNILAKEISGLLKDNNKRKTLAKNLLSFGHPDADKQIARIIIKTAEA